MFKKKDKIIPGRNESLSNELNEFVQCKPHWLIRNGIAIFFMLLCMVFCIAWFVKYPKIIKGPVHFVKSSENTYSGKMMIPKQKLKEIKTGQQVKLKIISSPNKEANYLYGNIDHILATPPINDSFLIDIKLASGIGTHNDSSILFSDNSSIQVEIISDNNRLLNHLLGGLKSRF